MRKRCIIITSYQSTALGENIDILPDDYIICADGGFEFALKENIVPDAIIGDFDSYSFDEVNKTIMGNYLYDNTEIIKTNPEKDDTDSLMCVKHGLEKKCTDFLLIGGLGGRLDHTIANLQILSYIIDNNGTAWILDGDNKATMIMGPDEINLEEDSSSYFSIYSYTEECTGIYEINAKYPLTDATLTNSFPLGTSNDFIDGPAIIKIDSGKLLIITSKK